MKYNPISTIATYLGFGAAAALAPSVASQSDIGALLGSPAHAQETKLAANVKIPDVKYKTVDEMLKGTPFEIVDLKTYQSKLPNHSKTAALLYRNDRPETDGRLVQIYREFFETNPELKDGIAFFAIKYDEDAPQAFRNAGFDSVPSVLYHLGGKKAGIAKGGPANDGEMAAARKMLLDHLKYLNTTASSQ